MTFREELAIHVNMMGGVAQNVIMNPDWFLACDETDGMTGEVAAAISRLSARQEDYLTVVRWVTGLS